MWESSGNIGLYRDCVGNEGIHYKDCIGTLKVWLAQTGEFRCSSWSYYYSRPSSTAPKDLGFAIHSAEDATLVPFNLL